MRAILAAAAVLAALATQAAAQPACPGSLSSTALRPVPADAVYGAALRTDSADQELLRDQLFAALRRAGKRVGDPPTHVISWRGGVASGGGTGGLSTADRLFNDRDAFQDSDDLRWMRDVPRNPRRGGGGGMGPIRLSGSVELREVASGRVIWTAVLSCQRDPMASQAALAATLVGAVVPAIGQTVGGRGF